MTNFIEDSRVALIKESPNYLSIPPFHPSESYPEWSEYPISKVDNPAYRAIRKLLYALGLDIENFDTRFWNPLSLIIKPGDTVLLKPNFVYHNNNGQSDDCLITHGSVIRATLDYVAKALQYKGKIIIGDAPIQGANWSEIMRMSGLNEIRSYYKKRFPSISFEIKDFRLRIAEIGRGQLSRRVVDSSMISEYCLVDLKKDSLLIPLMRGKYFFGVSQYPKRRMKFAHTVEHNYYLFPRDVINADLVINLPKLKCHKKAGITCALKNIVGINGHKDYLPHFRFGSPKHGGDEYPDGDLLWDFMWFFVHCDWEFDRRITTIFFQKAFMKCHSLLRKLYSYPPDFASVGGGSWHGNDTLWRTILDINRAFFYFDRKTMEIFDDTSPNVRYMTILDGLVGGDRESPLNPSPVLSGVMMAAFNPVALDTVAAAMMGFDIEKIKQITNAYKLEKLSLANFQVEDIRILGNSNVKTIQDIYEKEACIRFEPSSGFRGFIEYVK